MRTRLRAATNVLLDPASAFSDIARAAKAFHDLCASTTGISGDRRGGLPEGPSGTALASGLALAPFYAAQCLFFPLRTAVFVRGVRAAFAQAHRRFPGEVLEVVYAGCGPFAPLLLPQALDAGPGALRVTLIDIHEASVEAAVRLFEAAGLGGCLRDAVVCDAARYRHPPGIPLHLVVAEAMQKALIAEPQVAITRRLAPQLHARGLLVPERIVLEASFVDVAQPYAAAATDDEVKAVMDGPTARPLGRIDAGPVFEVSLQNTRGTGRLPASRTPDGTPVLPAAELRIPPLSEAGSAVQLHSTVHVFGPHVLRPGECVLTETHHLTYLAPRSGRTLALAYAMGPHPRLTATVR